MCDKIKWHLKQKESDWRLERFKNVSCHTATNVTDFIQVVDVTTSGLMEVCHQVASSLLILSSCIKTCWFYQVASSLLFHQVAASLRTSDLIQLDIRGLAASSWNNFHQACLANQLESMPLKTCDFLPSSWTMQCERMLTSTWWLQGKKPVANLLHVLA